MSKSYEVTCAGCGEAFEAGSPRAKWCSSGCKKRSQRKPEPQEPAPADDPAPDVESTGLVSAIRDELEAADRLDTYPGQLAMQLARRLVSPAESGISSLSKELRTVMDAALSGTTPPAEDEPAEDDEVEAARRRREEKAAAAAERA